LRAVKFANQGGHAASAFHGQLGVRTNLLFTMSNQGTGTAVLNGGHEFLFSMRMQGLVVGGARRDRTDDLMLAKHALSQLSYGPEDLGAVVGPGRVELPTSRLSGVRSNHLSYGPQFPDNMSEDQDCPIAVGTVKAGPIKSGPITSVCVREERETKTAGSRQNGPLIEGLESKKSNSRLDPSEDGDD
jgi:hypothetical protein